MIGGYDLGERERIFWCLKTHSCKFKPQNNISLKLPCELKSPKDSLHHNSLAGSGYLPIMAVQPEQVKPVSFTAEVKRILHFL